MGNYFTKSDRDQLIYYQVPKVLIVGDRYKDMKANAKLLYITLLDRMKLSLKNDWCDEQGIYYVRMSIEKGAELLGFSESTFKNMKKELNKFGLLEEDRQGQTKTNRLYILQCEYTDEDIARINKEVDDMHEEAEKAAKTVDISMTGKSYPSRQVKVTHQDRQILTTSKNKFNKNNSSKNEIVETFVNKEDVNNIEKTTESIPIIQSETINLENDDSKLENTINALVNEYRLKGLKKEVCLKAVSEVLANKENIDNFGGYLRGTLDNALYRVKVKTGKIDPTEKFNHSEAPFHAWWNN